ncbi:MAG: SIMPL domain-containing protein [Pseudomonadota bacterium]
MMNRKWIGAGLAAGALALAHTAPSAALAAEVEIEAEGPVIELSIYESVTADPDMATIGAGVSTEAPTAVAAMEANGAAMEKVIAQILALGVDEKDVRTTGISLNPQYDYDRQNRNQIFRGYQVSNRVSVKLREIDEVGAVLDALIAAGATNLNGPRFSIADDEAAKDQARERAIERGMKRARAYAALMGGDDVRVLEVNEALRGQSGFVAEAASDEMVAAAPRRTGAVVAPGQVSTGVSLVMKFEVVSEEDEEGAQE